MGLIIDPLAFILVAVHMPECTLAMCLIEAPVALIPCPVLPDLNASSMPILAFPLAQVLSTILEDKLGPVLHVWIIVGLVRLQAEASILVIRILTLLLALELSLAHDRRL